MSASKSIEKSPESLTGPTAGLHPSPPHEEANAFLALPRVVGNQAMLRLFASGMVQPKLRVSQPGDSDEQEADRVAAHLVSSRSLPTVQRKCACGGTCSQCQEEQDTLIHRSALEPLHPFPLALQRAASDEPTRRTATAQEGARHDAARHPGEHPQAVIVDDDTASLAPGQMRKAQFLTLLQTSACATADAVLESVGHSTKSCPYLKKWLEHYRDKDAQHLTRAMHKYAPETGRARSAHEAIALLNHRIERAALSWAKTGKVSGLPEDVQAELAGGSGFLGALAGFAASGFGSGLLGFLGGGKADSAANTASEGKVQKKSRDGAASGVHDVAAVKGQLGSGQALDGRVQSRFSSAFGYDFSGVRVHTDSKAAELSSQLNARAFTIGSDVAFAGGEYQPGSLIGDALIAHELAHVVQQGGGNAAAGPHAKDATLAENSQLEQDADHSAVGAVLSAWTGAKRSLADLPANALPRLKSGLRLQKCNCNKKEQLPAAMQISEEELQKYLDTLDRTGKVEALGTSANKAREVVRHWQRGDPSYILTARRKILLIQQIMDAGEAGAPLQSGILDLLTGTGGAEFEQIVKTFGDEELKSKLSEENRKRLEALLALRRSRRAAGDKPTPEEARETFPTEIVLESERQFKSNAEMGHGVRKNCIEIVRSMAPQLFASDPELAERVRRSLSRLRGVTLTMPDAGKALADLGVAQGPTDIRFNNGNGNNEPTAMTRSAWDTIISQVGKVEGWHIFGLAVFDGYHSVTVFVDNRPDGPRVYWADQWAIEAGEEAAFHQEPGSVSGFRRYQKAGFDNFITEKTREWWNEVHSPDSKCGQSHPKTWDRSCRYNATLKIWHLHSGG